MELTTDQKGAITEAAIVLRATKLGVGIYKPLSDGEPYDQIIDVRGRLMKQPAPRRELGRRFRIRG